MIRKNKTIILILCILAFAVGAYFLFKKGGFSSGREGLSRFSVQTFQKESGWGYRIYQDTIPVIEQQFIPGVAGKKGFESEQSARQTGGLVIKKLDQGMFPPTISPSELDSMHIKY